jgi:hypothetical protein
LQLRIALVTGAVMLTAAVAGTAVAGPNTSQTVDMTLSPAKAGTKSKPKRHELSFEATTTEPDGTQPPTIAKAVVYFPKGLRFNPGKFPKCKYESLFFNRPEECPAGSKVGSGSATAVSGDLTATPKLTAYNGEDGKSLSIYVTLQFPYLIAQPFKATLSKGTTAYPNKLTLPIPSNLQEPVPGVIAAITKFAMTVGATTRRDGKRIGYIETVKCPASGSFKVKGVFTARDGEQFTAESETPCD